MALITGLSSIPPRFSNTDIKIFLRAVNIPIIQSDEGVGLVIIGTRQLFSRHIDMTTVLFSEKY
jgi:hypothetical protein